MWFNVEDESAINDLRRMAPGDGVLSVYLPVERGMAIHHGYVPELMDLLRIERSALGAPADFQAEAERVLAYVREEFKPSGLTLAVFASQPRDLFTVLRLQCPLPGLVRFRGQPYLAPIEAMLDDDPRVAIAVVDQREARLIEAFMGKAVSEQHFEDDVPGRQRQGAHAEYTIERDRAHHVAQHYRHVGTRLRDIYRERPFKRLVLGGSPETVSAMLDELSTELRPLVAGSFPVELFATTHDLLGQALAIAEQAERAEESQLVDRIFDSAAAVVGWEPSIRCLGEGRVQRLALTASLIGTPRGDEALSKAWDTGASVEFVRGEAETRLNASDGIAALLRF
jgi:hypothetical protein